MFPSKSQHRPEVLTVSQGARALRRGAVLRDSLSQVVSWFGSNSWRRLGAGLWASLVKMFFPLCLSCSISFVPKGCKSGIHGK